MDNPKDLPSAEESAKQNIELWADKNVAKNKMSSTGNLDHGKHSGQNSSPYSPRY
jgi:hypothetical protein